MQFLHLPHQHNNPHMLRHIVSKSIRQSYYISQQQQRLTVHTFAAATRGSSDLLGGVAPEHKDDVKRILELAERARDNWEVVHTSFYSPAVVADAMKVINRLADVTAHPWGGYPQAERCRIILGREENMQGIAEDPGQFDSVTAVNVTGNFLFDKPTHRDFLGACLGTGIERTVVGDILVQEVSGAQILVSPTIVEHLQMSLTQVRSVPVRCQPLPLSELKVREPKVQEITSIEASLRVDAIASAGFRMSRSKMADLIKSGDVKLNWRSGVKTSESVEQGDVISCAGKGRLEVKGVSETKKGKFAVELVRYV